MVRNFNDTDQGKSVMTADGDAVGTIEQVRGSVAHVRPESGLAQNVRQRLGWTKEDEETYQLEKRHVDRIDDRGVHLKGDM